MADNHIKGSLMIVKELKTQRLAKTGFLKAPELSPRSRLGRVVGKKMTRTTMRILRLTMMMRMRAEVPRTHMSLISLMMVK